MRRTVPASTSPVGASPGNQVTAVGAQVNLTVAVLHAGLRPYPWIIGGLPDGLTANETGTIAGTPTGNGPRICTVTAVVIDANQLSHTMTFTWTITG